MKAAYAQDQGGVWARIWRRPVWLHVVAAVISLLVGAGIYMNGSSSRAVPVTSHLDCSHLEVEVTDIAARTYLGHLRQNLERSGVLPASFDKSASEAWRGNRPLQLGGHGQIGLVAGQRLQQRDIQAGVTAIRALCSMGGRSEEVAAPLVATIVRDLVAASFDAAERDADSVGANVVAGPARSTEEIEGATKDLKNRKKKGK